MHVTYGIILRERVDFSRIMKSTVQSIARAFEHCVIRCGLHNVSYWCIFNHVSRLYDLIFIKLPCEPGRKERVQMIGLCSRSRNVRMFKRTCNRL